MNKTMDRKKIRETVLSGVESALDSVEGQYDNISEKTSDAVASMKEKVSSGYESAKSKAIETREKTDKYVQDNPEKSLLIAAGVGALTAVIVSGLLRKRKKCKKCE